MADLLVQAYASDDTLVSGAVWSDGPKPGSRWMVVKVLDRNRFVLIRRARRGERHCGAWIVDDSVQAAAS